MAMAHGHKAEDKPGKGGPPIKAQAIAHKAHCKTRSKQIIAHIIATSWQGHGNAMAKPWQNHCNTMEHKTWQGHVNGMASSLQVIANRNLAKP